MDGVRLGARFSIATNRLRFCGPSDAEPTLYRAVTEGVGLDQAAEALGRFEALFPYLEAIGRVSGRSPWDERVVEAYWIGNELLDRFPPDEFPRILEALALRGLPGFVARELADGLPPRPIPHHLFHVAYVGVGAVTGHVETTLPNMELCRPSWGTVTSVTEGTVRLRSAPLVAADGALSIGEEGERVASYDPRFLPEVAPGSVVAAHWGWAAMELSRSQAAALAHYSSVALEQANRAHRRVSPASSRSPTDGAGASPRNR